MQSPRSRSAAFAVAFWPQTLPTHCHALRVQWLPLSRVRPPYSVCSASGTGEIWISSCPRAFPYHPFSHPGASPPAGTEVAITALTRPVGLFQPKGVWLRAPLPRRALLDPNWRTPPHPGLRAARFAMALAEPGS